MPKKTFKTPTGMKKGVSAKGAKGKKIVKPEKKTKKKKPTAKKPAAPKSAAASSSKDEPSTSGLGAGPNSSSEDSPSTSVTNIETSSTSVDSLELTDTIVAEHSYACPAEKAEIALFEKSNAERDDTSSEEVTETASETESNPPSSIKSIPPSPPPLTFLQNKWTLWLYLPIKGVPWEECQSRVYSFNTGEHFWSMFNHLIKPSDLPPVADLALFKRDYRPMWEDPINKNGGRWLITLNRHRQKDIEDVWREASLFLIGENFQYSDSVCGVVISHRSYCDKIAIWTSNKLEHEVMSIGRNAKHYMELDFSPQMAFESHAQTQFNASTFGKASSKTVYKL